jgi:hypothetical protein
LGDPDIDGLEAVKGTLAMGELHARLDVAAASSVADARLVCST